MIIIESGGAAEGGGGGGSCVLSAKEIYTCCTFPANEPPRFTTRRSELVIGDIQAKNYYFLLLPGNIALSLVLQRSYNISIVPLKTLVFFLFMIYDGNARSFPAKRSHRVTFHVLMFFMQRNTRWKVTQCNMSKLRVLDEVQ